mmetsp:Transcript_93938/g.148434  ORF Transcript_93938/g.148434 Transcript_93938/m.148434 type:complete len:673 (-) Transcript_93938:57-2075(-)|eukprot:CAMPEP_0169099932 /NCGR_PEP_ID=MMETSP1015-20121227/20817_1 /TAXON_ID=342587 /ORGANISM="Karlodinium micrum, Strain CCMP2283" /LENGTH=672 /DNA_ID=CAMNT_0009160839 /DNA_START=92 /DNA_END=2110 /DNA_ORIENTATION=-
MGIERNWQGSRYNASTPSRPSSRPTSASGVRPTPSSSTRPTTAIGRAPARAPVAKSRAAPVFAREKVWEEEEEVEAPPTPPFDDVDPPDEVFTPNGEDEAEQEFEPEAEAELDFAEEPEEYYNPDEVDEPEDNDIDMEGELPEEPPEEEEGEFQLAAHWGLLDAVDDGDNFYEDPLEEYEEPEDSEPEETKLAAGDSNVRADDIAVDEVHEHLRDAVEGSERIKKILQAEDDDPPSKRRKTHGYDDDDDWSKLTADGKKLLRGLKVDGNSTCRYVVEASPAEEVENVMKSNFFFKEGDRKSIGEQLNDQFIRLRERKMVHGSKIDACAAFGHRHQLKEEDDRQLRKLVHKDLRYVLEKYDGEQALKEVIDEAKDAEPESGPTGGAPQKPGLLTFGRFNRLELISPVDKALVVGDANLTFSLLLAQHRKDLGHTGHTIATTFELLDTLKERYQEIEETIQKLTDLGAEVLHNVDCTKLYIDKRFETQKGEFGAVYYNFPHAGAVTGFFDGHPFVRWRHENLMHLFFRGLTNFVKPGGSVKVASNQRAQGVRFSDIISAAESCEFVHTETVPFTEWTLRNYNRSYGDKRDVTKRLKDGEVYNAQRGNVDMVYCFIYKPSGGPLGPLRVRPPPSKKHMLRANEGILERLSGERKQRKVEELTQLFLSYVQGIHVG